MSDDLLSYMYVLYPGAKCCVVNLFLFDTLLLIKFGTCNVIHILDVKEIKKNYSLSIELPIPLHLYVSSCI